FGLGFGLGDEPQQRVSLPGEGLSDDVSSTPVRLSECCGLGAEDKGALVAIHADVAQLMLFRHQEGSHVSLGGDEVRHWYAPASLRWGDEGVPLEWPQPPVASGNRG